MKPRTAGILGITAALTITVLSGGLIAVAPFSLLGALGVVGGMILFAVSGTLVVRNSWDPARWPTLSISAEEATRKYRRFAMWELGLGPLGVGLGVWAVVVGQFQGWFAVLIGLSAIGTGITMLRAIKKAEIENLREPTQ
jgi:hypothetical protein